MWPLPGAIAARPVRLNPRGSARGPRSNTAETERTPYREPCAAGNRAAAANNGGGSVNIAVVAVSAFGALFPITNPLGAVAVFAGLTSTTPPAQARRQAIMTAVYVFAILATFALLGSLVLRAFGISLPALQIAGGI